MCLALCLTLAVSGVVPLGRACWDGDECICPARRIRQLAAAQAAAAVRAPGGAYDGRLTPGNAVPGRLAALRAPGGACKGGCCGGVKQGEPDRPASPRDACGSCSWCPLLSVVERDRDMPARSDGPRSDGGIPLAPILPVQHPMPCSLALASSVLNDGRPPPEALSGGLFDLHCSLLI